MKKVQTIEELRSENLASLAKMIDDTKAEVAKTKLALSFGKEKNVKKILNLRKKIAQIWTIIFEKMNSGDENGK